MKTTNQTLKQYTLNVILFSAFLLLNFIALSNNGGNSSYSEMKEKSAFRSTMFVNKKAAAENKKCSFRFLNPFKKSVLPSTYVKFVLNSKRGSFLNIKIGYIN